MAVTGLNTAARRVQSTVALSSSVPHKAACVGLARRAVSLSASVRGLSSARVVCAASVTSKVYFDVTIGGEDAGRITMGA